LRIDQTRVDISPSEYKPVLQRPAAMPIKLLIVDDHAMMRHALRRLFSGTEIEVVGEAETAAEALRLALAQPVDAVVLDLHLPDGDSLDVLKKIKSVKPDLRVFIHSSDSSSQWIERAKQSGADDYFIKGQDSRRLMANIEALANPSAANQRRPMPPRQKHSKPTFVSL
jgi:DNA-binding NarL/FixJ family response regulator